VVAIVYGEQTTTTVATTIHKKGYIQWQKKLERRIHSSRGDVFMNRKTNGINSKAVALALVRSLRQHTA
jgi:hypothetical protein